jgi:glyoxylase-like metal-dependent hydrolase (beta-lactamase superfamily II)
VELKDGVELSLADGAIKCKVMHTPGHSQGSCCFLLQHSGTNSSLLSSGDTLFCGSVGRSDLPGTFISTWPLSR